MQLGYLRLQEVFPLVPGSSLACPRFLWQLYPVATCSPHPWNLPSRQHIAVAFWVGTFHDEPVSAVVDAHWEDVFAA